MRSVPVARQPLTLVVGALEPARPCALAAAALAATILLAACSQEVDTAHDAPTAAGLLALPGPVGSTQPDRADAAALQPDNAVSPGPVAPGAVASPGSAPILASVLYSERDAELRARARGVVMEINVELGDAVTAGQLLARLDDAEQRAAMAVAEATLELARLEHDRVAALLERELIETAEADRARYRLLTATADRDRAQALLDYTRIRAPFDGIVTRRFVRLGEMVEETNPLFRVTAPRPLRVRVMVPEARALALEVGQQARLVGVGGTATATIARISPAVDPSSGSVEALLNVPRPGSLRPGSAVRVEWDRAPPSPSRTPEPR